MNRKPGLAALTVASLMAAAAAVTAADVPRALPTVVAVTSTAARVTGYDGVVEAVRQTVVSSRVPGVVVALPVKAGDRVKANQLLLQLDALAAEQHAASAAAQLQAARAAQEVALKELERQRQLFQKQYISKAALDHAEALYKSTRAQSAAQQAAAAAARTESGFYTVRAPYDGIVAEVSVMLGDMAMPGKPLMTVYDPAALRVAAAVPQTATPERNATPQLELPGVADARITPVRWQVLPAADPATHTVLLRFELPPGTAAAPGTFARAWLPDNAGAAPRLWVPGRAVLRRSELVGVYVIDTAGRPLLRQVRVGATRGELVEVLSGLEPGERVVLDPQAAARVP